MTKRIRLVIAIGTRPEAVKMAPIIRLARRHADRFDTLVVSTSQHREMLAQMLSAFNIKPDIDLKLMQHNQGLTEFASRSLAALGQCFDQIKPEAVLVQGDTTTVLAAALAAFHRKLVVGHVEAGLRSFNSLDPFPEEANRRMAATLATLHFAPTKVAQQNLLRENIPARSIFITGNTVVDALQMIRLGTKFDSPALRKIPLKGKRMLLITAHRRENHGGPLLRICLAIKTLARNFKDIHIVFPVHLHPSVRSLVYTNLDAIPGISLIEPVGYPDLLRLIRRSYLILTDSGGIQEEAPSFHKPVLILRETTERPEVVDAGGGALVGTGTRSIVSKASTLLDDRESYQSMCLDQNPFGDGRAAHAILNILTSTFHHSQKI